MPAVPREHVHPGQQAQHIQYRLGHRVAHQHQTGGHSQDGSGKPGDALDNVGGQDDQEKQGVVHH